ncbi:tetratricopeptide repeat protein [Skermanella rosea]|uniref:tetratricopeptide repeat protein n=1 Tax=Skermanella rosea TaxID=1817965 RepID=UPI001932AEFE|nr:tetratricopeptide repeat protein [Skermanella rosea]UEM04243.1 tetratricopeptide repeat protein [Skermanella rosea]
MLAELLKTAQHHHEAGRLAEAARACRQAMALAPPAGTLLVIGQVGAQAGDWDLAADAFGLLVAARPWDPDILLEYGIARRHQGRPDAAAEAYRRAIGLDPGMIEAWLNLGHALLEQGNPAEAAGAFGTAAALAPDQPPTHANLGMALLAAGDPAGAEAAFRGSLARDPSGVPALAGLGTALVRLGRLSDAAEVHRHALAIEPSLASAWHDLAMVLTARELPEQAAAAARRAALCDPTDPAAPLTLGNILLVLDRLDGAEAAYRRAASLRPDGVEAWNNLGFCLNRLGRHGDARDALARAATVDPGYATAWSNLGAALAGLGRHGEAVAMWLRTLRVRPDHPEALISLANARLRDHRLEAAAATLGHALAVTPDFARAQTMLGNILLDQGHTGRARTAFRQARRLCGDPGLEVKEALALPIIPESEAHIREVRERLADGVARLTGRGIRLRDPLAQVGQTCFYLAYHAADDRPLQEAVAGLYEAACPDLLQDRADPPARPDGRTHVGFVSQYWHQHTIAKLNLGLIRNLDRERFHVTLFTTPHAGDAMRDALVRAADATVELPLDLRAARDAIATRRLDVLYYADIGMSALTYFLAFARLAPLQCLAWGHPDTTGIRNLDRFLSCAAMEPDGAERHYSERLIRLPGTTLHYARPRLPARPKPRSAFGLPDDARLYVCPQSLFKIHPDFDRALVELLRRDPRGLVVLLSGRDRNLDGLLRRRLAAAGADVAARFRFLRQMPLPDFLSLVACSDVMLDPLHYSGGNTSLEAFALGTPIVTWPGAFMRGRHTHGFYRLMGLDDCVARDHAHYVDIALDLASQPDRRAHVIRRVLDRVPLLFDDTQSVRAIENEILRTQ